MQTLYPSSALMTSWLTSSNTIAWLASGPNTRSKSNACAGIGCSTHLVLLGPWLGVSACRFALLLIMLARLHEL